MDLQTNNIAYIRISSKGQETYNQEQLLLSHGLLPQNLFIDKAVNALTNPLERSAFSTLLTYCTPNTMVYIYSLDRIGRNFPTVLQGITAIQYTGATLKILSTVDSHYLGTDIITPTMLMNTPPLQCLTMAYEVEYFKKKEACNLGYRHAQQAGCIGGRPPIKLSEKEKKILFAFSHRQLSLAEVKTQLPHMSQSTIYNKLHQLNYKT